MRTFFIAFAVWCAASMPAAAFNLDPLHLFSPAPAVSVITQASCMTKTQARRQNPTEHLWYNVSEGRHCWHSDRIAPQHTVSHTTKPSQSKAGSITKCSLEIGEVSQPKPQKVKYIPETYDWLAVVKKQAAYYNEPP